MKKPENKDETKDENQTTITQNSEIKELESITFPVGCLEIENPEQVSKVHY